jgi:hypothetical protein
LISREKATTTIHPDVIHNNPPEDILQNPSTSPITTTDDTISCSTWTTKDQFVSKQYEDAFYLHPCTTPEVYFHNRSISFILPS